MRAIVQLRPCAAGIAVTITTTHGAQAGAEVRELQLPRSRFHLERALSPYRSDAAQIAEDAVVRGRIWRTGKNPREREKKLRNPL